MTARDPFQISALMVVADWHWRQGPLWKTALAWLFGRRERLTTHLGDRVTLSWWRDNPYLVSVRRPERKPGQPCQTIPPGPKPARK